MLSYSLQYPIQLVTNGNPVNFYLTSTVDKTHHGAVLDPFSVRLVKFFSYAEGVLVTNLFSVIDDMLFCYAANYNIQGAFVIIFLICNDLLNCLISVGTIVITTESG